MATLKIKRISDFQTESVQWLCEPYIPLGAVTILQGDGGLGKSTISCLIAAAVTNGKGLPVTAMPGEVHFFLLVWAAQAAQADADRRLCGGRGSAVSGGFGR